MEKYKVINIAIDGPAGAGKSTVAKAIAKELGIVYLDTGAMYRTLGLACKRAGLQKEEEDKILALLHTIAIDIRFLDGTQHVFLDDEDVSTAIREGDISVWASDVSKIPTVRMNLVQMQREIAEGKAIVMDGRDIGTHVLPNAACKIFLTADVEERAKRRHEELLAKGDSVEYSAVLKDIQYRDAQDSQREFAPLKKAEDAILLDTSDMEIEEVLTRVLAIVHEVEAKL